MGPVELSVIIPVYRSEATLRPLLNRLLPVLDAITQDSEVILIDDGSPDHAWEVILDLRREHPGKIVAVQLMRNFGQHNALMCGFHHARGRLVVTMDDDLQHPPESIATLLAALRDRDLDLVYGSYEEKMHDPGRVVGSWLVNGFFRLIFQTSVTVTSFRAIRRELVRSILCYDLNFTYVDGLLAWNTQRAGEVAVPHHSRQSGRSGYSFWKLATLALNLFTNFSLLPLQIVSVCGSLAAGAGLILAAYYFIQSLRHNITVPGYASIIIAVLVLGGIQLMSLGIMGEYLGRLHLNVNRKPQYVERQVFADGPNVDRVSSPVDGRPALSGDCP